MVKKILNAPNRVIRKLWSFYLCSRLMSLQNALKVPICFAYNVRVKKSYRGCIKFSTTPTPYLVYWGFERSATPGIYAPPCEIIIEKGGCALFTGTAHICKGGVIYIEKGTVKFGNNFYANKNFFVRCDDTVSFGDDCLIGWNVAINTNNGHMITYGDVCSSQKGAVTIGNHVWIASDVKVSKGVNIPNGCVIAQNSLVTKSFSDNNVLIGGVPAKPLKYKVEWKA